MALVPSLVADLRTQLQAAGDPTRALSQQRYMKSEMPFYGIAVPEVRRIARRTLREHPIGSQRMLRETVRDLWDHASHREEWYAALALCAAPSMASLRTRSLLPLYRHLVVTGAWWDVVDDVATHLVAPLVQTDPAPISPVMRRWATDKKLWLRRSAVLCQIGAKTDTDPQLLTDVIEPNLDRSEFFLRKAIGWALRDYAWTNPDWVRAYLSTHHEQLSPLSRREAGKHLG